MMNPETIGAMVDLLDRRQASLWHACQLTDFHSYLQLGGIPTRAALHAKGMDFTAFASDPIDRARGYWDQQFFCLDDIGAGFARGWTMSPNVFGPIVLQVQPAVLRTATGVQVSLRTPSNAGFEPGLDTIDSPEDLDRCFLNPSSAQFPQSTFVRFGDALREAFEGDRPDAATVEVSFGSTSPIPLDRVVAVWVDPVTVEGVQLIDIVSALAEQTDPRIRVRPRQAISDDRRSIWKDLAAVLKDGEAPLLAVWNRADTSIEFREWAAAIRARGLDWLFARFGQYLYRGTLRPLAAAHHVDRREAEAAPRPSPLAAPALAVRADRPSGLAATTVAGSAAPRTVVRACGHLVQPWDHGTCYVCVGRRRTKWRYD